MGNSNQKNCSCCNVPTPDINATISNMNEKQKVALCFDAMIGFLLLIFFSYDCVFFKRRLSESPRLQAVLFIQSSFVFYAITSLLAIISPRSSTLTELVFTVYLSFTLKEILWLMIEYLGGEKYAIPNLNGVRASLAVAPCACMFCWCCPVRYVNRKYLFWVKFGVYQTCILHTVFDFIDAFLWTNEYYKDGDVNPNGYAFYLMLLGKISILVAVYALTSLYISAKKELNPYHITGKLFCIQMVLIISGFQDTVFVILASIGVIQCKQNLSATDRATVLHHYAVVPEMLILYVLSRYFHTKDEGTTDALSRRATVIEYQQETDSLCEKNSNKTSYQSFDDDVDDPEPCQHA